MTRVSVRYTAFGAMAVSVDGVEVPLTRRRERNVLAVLLAAHGAPVAAERLVAEVWGDEAPGQTLASLQVAVSRLRSQLEPDRKARKGSRLVSTAAGYSLLAEIADVDTWTFESLAEQALAAAQPAERLQLADEARYLWTTTPYADCDAPTVRSETSRLEELMLTVEEVRARALLDLGRPDEALRGLAELAPRHPYRERLWSLLALAQYRCSRQADALETLRRLREQLADELGVDPSEEIQRLEQAVLRQDPELSAPASVADAAPAEPPTGRVASSRMPTATSAGTIGRSGVLDQALSLLDEPNAGRATRFLLVAGEPGIGKSRLVADLNEAASTRGVRVLVGRCHEDDYAPALWPWLGIVRALSDGTEVDPLLIPLLEGEVSDAGTGAGTGLRMFDAVVDLIARSAATSPLLLVLEDIHWSDSHVAAADPTPRHVGGADAGSGALHAAYDRGADERCPRGHVGGAGPGRGGATTARRARQRLGRRAAHRVRGRARPPARRVRGATSPVAIRSSCCSTPASSPAYPTSSMWTPPRCRCRTGCATSCVSGCSGCLSRYGERSPPPRS